MPGPRRSSVTFDVRKNADVFLNIPFDRAYERCYVALIADLAACGMRPRTVLEFVPEPEDERLRRLWRALRSCAVSLHDLSRQRGRFNMPFEAGLAKALQLGGRRHKFLRGARSEFGRRFLAGGSRPPNPWTRRLLLAWLRGVAFTACLLPPPR